MKKLKLHKNKKNRIQKKINLPSKMEAKRRKERKFYPR